MNKLPDKFLERLHLIVPQDKLEAVIAGFARPRPIVYRFNPLKGARTDILGFFEKEEIEYEQVSWYSDAFILPEKYKGRIVASKMMEQGILYRQSLSSMLVPIILDPHPGDAVLDMCAAPGSKTSQIAALNQNNGKIVAIEHIKQRFYKLKSVIGLLGVENIVVKLLDARRFRSEESFDRILVDVPCSSEGRFSLLNKKTFQYWSERKIKEMRRKQRGILLNASRYLNSEGTMIYSTCTFAPEENEGVIDWFLRKTDGEYYLAEIETNVVENYPCVTQWRGKTFSEDVKKCLRISPNEKMENFFIAKIKKK